MEDFEREEQHLLPQAEAPCEPEPMADLPQEGADRLEGAQTQAPQAYGQPQWYYTRQAVQAACAQQSKVPQMPKKKGISALGVIVIALVCALLGGVAGSLLTRVCLTPPAPSTDAALLARIEALEQAAQKVPLQQSYDAQPIATATQVYEQNVGCVVGINNEATTANVFGQTSGIASVGSGFIVREDGYVVTNYHVVNGTQALHVTLRDGTQYPALVVGYDSGLDVAVLKIEAEGLQTIKVGDSDLLRVGDQVAAIGNPLGELTLSMTVGYISALDREINTDGIPVNMLQTDVAINAGNSGGPLFDMKGNVIGITTAKYSGSTSSGSSIEGIGFALPINDVMKIVDDLLELGYISGRAYLGITAMDMDPQTAEVYSLPVGAYVSSVVDGFCAQKAGLKTGDIILSLGENEISSYADLSRALREFAPGEETAMEIFRAGARMTLRVTFDERPSDAALEQAAPQTQPNQNASGYDSGDMEDWFHYFFGG